MSIYVVRHGRTNNNDLEVFNGRIDEDINETGIKQAKELTNKIKEIKIDLIICSPLIRAKHTAEIININSVPIIYDDRLIERDTGELTLKPYKDVDRDEYWNYYSEKYKNVEKVPDLFKRVYSILDFIKKEYQNKDILIVTHNGVARAIYTYFNKIPLDGKVWKVGTQKNCEMRKYDFEN